MCVAIYKPKGVETPSLETLEKCWNQNPDGAGFAFRTNDKKYPVQIAKGFMSWKAFKKAFIKYKLDSLDGDLLLHFRITTHGGTNAANTHPFAISNNIKILRYCDLKTNYALIHNGILPIEPSNKTISDTMELCKRLADGGYYKDIATVFNLIDGMVGTNKIAVMDSKTVNLFGDWQTVDGVKYSNLLWQPYEPPAASKYLGFYSKKHSRDYEDNQDIIDLQDGYCPYCSSEITQVQSVFLCPACGEMEIANDAAGNEIIELY